MKNIKMQIQGLLLILMISLPLVLIAQKNKKSKKPNVIYILTDQWRSSALGYTGNPDVKTPHLDQFSKEAVNLSNAVSVSPVCTPHRASLMTGRYPTTTGMFLNDLYLPSEELCMAEIFKADGYNTGYLGKWHLDGHGRLNNVEPERRQGFDYWKALECSHDYANMPYYDNDDPKIKYWDDFSPFSIAEDANNYITEHSENENPFLLFVSIATPHFPHDNAPDEFNNLYPESELTLPPNLSEEWKSRARKELRGYYAQCTASDRAIGSILDKVKELNLWDDTIIVFTADHGEMMGAHGVRPWAKQRAWDESIKVPFLISYPAISKNKGATINAPINTPDILPSLLGLANLEIPATIEGDDISKLIKSPNPESDRAALVMNVCPFDLEHEYEEYRAIRTKQYTYARSPEKATLLFDNIADPYQQNNLIDNADFEILKIELDTKLKKELEQIGEENFKNRDYYLDKWNLKISNRNHAIDYFGFDEGKGIVQTPKFGILD